MNKICDKDHRYSPEFESLPDDQGGSGRHKCAGCAYEKGFNDGLLRKKKIDLDLESLPESQAGTVRHKSPDEAYSLGYSAGSSKSKK